MAPKSPQAAQELPTHKVDGVGYTLHPDSPLAGALAQLARQRQVVQGLIESMPVLKVLPELQSQLAQLEAAQAEPSALDAPLDLESEVKIVALKRRIEQLQPSYTTAITALHEAQQVVNEAQAQIKEYEQRIRVAALQQRQLADQRRAFESQHGPAEAQIGRDLRLVLGDLKPGDVRQPNSPDQPRPFWPVGSGYTPAAPVLVQVALTDQERQRLMVAEGSRDYEESQAALRRGSRLVEYQNGREQR